MGLKVMNAGSTFTTNLICKGTLMLGKLIAIALSLGIYRYLIVSVDKYAELNESLATTGSVCVYIIVGLFAFLIVSVFLSVYELALDTILICFFEDQERNDGKSRPYYSSAKLQK